MFPTEMSRFKFPSSIVTIELKKEKKEKEKKKEEERFVQLNNLYDNQSKFNKKLPIHTLQFFMNVNYITTSEVQSSA